MLHVSVHESSVSVDVDASSTPGHVTPPPTLDLHLDDEQTQNVEKIESVTAVRGQARQKYRSKTPSSENALNSGILNDFFSLLHGFAKRLNYFWVFLLLNFLPEEFFS